MNTLKIIPFNEEGKVILWTKNMYSRSVPRKIIEGIRNMEIGPKNNVFTECKSIVDLDQFINYLNDALVTEASGGGGSFRCFEMLLLGAHYGLSKLVRESANAICDSLYSRTFYFQIPPSVLLEYRDELQRLLSDINSPSFPIMVPFQSSDGLCRDFDLLLTKTFFTKISVEHNLNCCYKKLKMLKLPCKMETFETVIEYMEKGPKFEMCNDDKDQLEAIMKISCLLGYRKLFCEAVIMLKGVSHIMSGDIYNLLAYCNIGESDDRKDSYEDLMGAIEPHLSNMDWRNDEVTPYLVGDIISDIKLDAVEKVNSRILFLRRDPEKTERLTTIKAKKTPAVVVHEFLKLNPEEVQKFWNDEDCLKSETYPELLLYFLNLGSEFGYDRMYFEAYLAILRESIALESLVPLHGHFYKKEEIEEWKRTGDSMLVTLVAEDGARAKIHKNTLMKMSGFFKLSLDNLMLYGRLEMYSDLIFPVTHCPDAVVLNIWMEFMVGTSTQQRFIKSPIGCESRQKVYANLRRIASFYMVPGILPMSFDNDLYEICYDFHLTYNSIPSDDFLSSEERERGLEKREFFEFNHFDRIYDAPYILNMDIFQFTMFLFRMDLEEFWSACENAIALYVDVNADYLKKIDEIPEGVFAMAKYNNKSLARIVGIMGQVWNRCRVSILLKIEQYLRNFGHLPSIVDSPLILVEEFEFFYGVTLYIHSENYEFFQIDVDTLDSKVEDILEMRIFKQQLIWFESWTIKVRDFSNNSIRNLSLPSVSDELVVIFCMDELIAITIPGEDDGLSNLMWRYESEKYTWQRLDLDSFGCALRGKPWVGGDRLYFLPTSDNDDWVRYIVKAPYDGDDLNFEVRFIEPLGCHAELFGLLKYSPKRKFSFSFKTCAYCQSTTRSHHECPNQIYSDLVCPPEEKDHGFLFVKDKVLVIKKDNLEIVERREWPGLPKPQGFDRAVFSDKCFHILYVRPNNVEFSVYKFDFGKWDFVRVITGSSVDETIWDIFASDGNYFTNYPDDCSSLGGSSKASDTYNEEDIAKIFEEQKEDEGNETVQFYICEEEGNLLYS